MLLSILLLNACCKEPFEFKKKAVLERATEENQLPHSLPILSNVANDEQTKGIFFYNGEDYDVVFRSIGVKDTSTENTKLWVQVLNPDIKVFADVEVNTFYGDTVLVGSTSILEIHNRDVGNNFYQMDTALLALPFTDSLLDTWRPRLLDQSIATVHVQFKESFNTAGLRYDIERGVLKRKNNEYVGFKNTVTGDVFFVELANRYTLKSIVIRKD